MATQRPSPVRYACRGVVGRPVAVAAGMCRAGRDRGSGPGRRAAAPATRGRSPGRVAAVAGRDGRARASTAYAPAIPATPSASPNGGSVGGPSSGPVGRANPLIASISVPKALLGVRSAEPGEYAQHHQPRVEIQERVGSQAPLLHDAGPEVLHDASASAASSRSSPCPSGLPKFSVIARSSAITFHQGRRPLAVPAVRAGRVAVGALAPSNTSAPMSPSSIAVIGGVDRADIEDLDAANGPGCSGCSICGRFVVSCCSYSTPSSTVADRDQAGRVATEITVAAMTVGRSGRRGRYGHRSRRLPRWCGPQRGGPSERHWADAHRAGLEVRLLNMLTGAATQPTWSCSSASGSSRSTANPLRCAGRRSAG